MVRGSPNPRHLRMPARLRKARKTAGLTRKALVLKVGGGESAARDIEMGQRMPTVGMIARLAPALSVSAAWLAYGIGDMDTVDPAATCEGMGERLLATRMERGHTKASLGRAAALSPSSIGQIESGGQAGVDTIERIAKALHISPAWLAYGVEPQVLPPRRAARASRPTAEP